MKSLVLILAASVCAAQHIDFGPLLNGSPVANPALDSAGNLYLLLQTPAFGLGPAPTRLATLLTQYGRDGSLRLLQETGFEPTDVPAVLAVNPQGRVYAGANRDGRPLLKRFNPDGSSDQTELFEPFTRLVGIAFAPIGDPVIASDSARIQLVRLDARTLTPIASRVVNNGNAIPEQSALTQPAPFT